MTCASSSCSWLSSTVAAACSSVSSTCITAGATPQLADWIFTSGTKWLMSTCPTAGTLPAVDYMTRTLSDMGWRIQRSLRPRQNSVAERRLAVLLASYHRSLPWTPLVICPSMMTLLQIQTMCQTVLMRLPLITPLMTTYQRWPNLSPLSTGDRLSI